MKKLNIFFGLLICLVLLSCASDELESGKNVGYLKLDVAAVVKTNNPDTRSDAPNGYVPKQLAVEIVNAAGVTVESTNDYTKWTGKTFSLLEGKYTIMAHSNNWDGSGSGFDVPYYAGSTEVTVKKNESITGTVKCVLANVKVSVDFDPSIARFFSTATAEIISGVSGVSSRTFEMKREEDNSISVTPNAPVYFPVGTLTAKLSVVSVDEKLHTMETPLKHKDGTPVQARDFYQLNYKVVQTGAGTIKVEADNGELIYEFYFSVPTEAKTTLMAFTPDAWATFAYLQGSIPTADITIDPSKVKFQYQEKGASEWSDLAATSVGEVYKATLKNLKPNTDYSYKMVYGENEYSSSVKNFKTDIAPQLPNASFEDWYKNSDDAWYAASSTDYANNLFWDSGNEGTSIVNLNATQPSSDARTDSKSANLVSLGIDAFVIKKFAAGSLYAGQFNSLVGTNGAKIDFGRDFTARPSQMTGWFKYSTGAINWVGDNQPEGTVVKGQTQDLWSAYIVLMTEGYQLDNTRLAATSIDFAAGKDERVIAYGALPDEYCVTSNIWKKFTINLHYFKPDVTPSKIVIVISSSKYGDYFTGSDASNLLIDDLELVYDEPIQ